MTYTANNSEKLKPVDDPRSFPLTPMRACLYVHHLFNHVSTWRRTLWIHKEPFWRVLPVCGIDLLRKVINACWLRWKLDPLRCRTLCYCDVTQHFSLIRKMPGQQGLWNLAFVVILHYWSSILFVVSLARVSFSDIS